MRCTAEEDAVVQHETPEAAEKTEHGDLTSHSVADSPVEEFGGWSEIAFESEPESSWKDGVSTNPIFSLLYWFRSLIAGTTIL